MRFLNQTTYIRFIFLEKEEDRLKKQKRKRTRKTTLMQRNVGREDARADSRRRKSTR
jgi:hypothetical protein